MSPGGLVPTDASTAGGRGDRAVVDGGTGFVDRRTAALLCAAVGVGFVALVLLAGVGGATVPAEPLQQDNDTVGPSLGTATKVDDVTIDVAITDDVDVDESSISTADFALSTGRLENVTVTEDGSNATVRLHLADPVNTDPIRVSLADGAVITDESGKPLRATGAGTRTVDDMDGVAPFVTAFRARPGGNGSVDLRLAVDDRLAALAVEVTGPRTDRLGLSDFEHTHEGGRDVYETTYDPGADGEYRFRVSDVADGNGNDDSPRVGGGAVVDTTPPDAVAVVDVQASSERNYTFDASRSTDLIGVANVTWALGDGTNATGERVTHRYEPGNYTVRARVTDARGNTATDTLFVVAGAGNASLGAGTLPNASATVRLTDGGDSSSTLVRVTGATAGTPVSIPTSDGRAVAFTDTITLERVTVTPAANASYRLGVQIDGPAAVDDATASLAGAGLGGFTVVHDVPDGALDTVTMTVAVDRATVAETGAEPEAVGLYRRHDGDWQPLETTLVDRSNATLRYRATAPGFSRFAVVAGGDTGAAAADATPETGQAGATPTGPPTTASPSESDGSLLGLGGLLGLLPLGVLDGLVRYVGSVLVAAFLLLKSVALVLGY